ncbi:MAG: hypothetical protein OEM28_08575 [Nitrosopumilus sp.]|nr:hypothetical protein [Nitrosopumilus sp.]MDH3487904.1 hypothetical protein [Nitrosopumilus sp.]
MATLTVDTGKDMYLARVKVIFHTNTITRNLSAADEVVLKVNDTIIETAKYSANVSSGSDMGGDGKGYCSFENIGHKVAQVK